MQPCRNKKSGMTVLSHAPTPALHPLQIFIVIILYHFKVCNKGTSKIHLLYVILPFSPSFVPTPKGLFVNIAEKTAGLLRFAGNAPAVFPMISVLFAAVQPALPMATSGSVTVPLTRTSKCRWGSSFISTGISPTLPITSPILTLPPFFTAGSFCRPQ